MQDIENQPLTQGALPDFFAGTNGKFYRRIVKFPNKFFEFSSQEDAFHSKAMIADASQPDAFPRDRHRKLTPEVEVQRFHSPNENIEPGEDKSEQKSPNEEHAVHVEPGEDLNDVWKRMSRQQAADDETKSESTGDWDSGTMGQWDKSSFDKNVYEALPNRLRDACELLTTDTEREVFLVGALGVVSGLMPNVLGHYDGKYVGPNLFTYIHAPYGCGKGGLEYARLLGDAIHRGKRKEYDQNLAEYQQDQERYDLAKKASQKDKSAQPPPPPKPAPPQIMLFIPANNSKSGLYKNLAENNERGVIIETEGDTLADALKQDYAGFTDLLRNAFHHERCTFFRRGNGGEYVEITRPFLSLVLSSTFDQLKTLMPTPENGLFSRFLFYEMKGSAEFRNVFDKRKRNYADYFGKMGDWFEKMYNHLEPLPEPIYFDLTDQQQAAFVDQFQAWKDELREYVAKDLDGTVNRLGLICFRVAMVLTVIRAFDTGEKIGAFVCSDNDYANALSIVETLKIHAVRVYNKLPKAASTADAEPADEKKQKQQCQELFSQGMSCRDISTKVFGDESKKSTVYRWTH
ncbi:DUF3987 domain-containing protein [Spirosoma areae]